jgi:N-acetylneuraminic acid mutarotase
MKTFTWNPIKTRGDIVKPRDEHSAVVDEANSAMVVFGGFEEGERTNETIIYNLKTNVWTKVKLTDSAKRPCPRSGHSACVSGHTMYVFGGKSDNSHKLNDLWAFDMQSHSWSQVNPVDDEMPETRSGHSAIIYHKIMIIFGGIFEVTRELNDVLAFSIP